MTRTLLIISAIDSVTPAEGSTSGGTKVRLTGNYFDKTDADPAVYIDGNCDVLTQRERNVLFNDALNTFYLRLYGVRHMVKDHSDSEKENPLPPHRLLLSINSKGSFICTIPQTG